MRKSYLFSIISMLIVSSSWVDAGTSSASPSGDHPFPPANNPFWNTATTTRASYEISYTLDPINQDSAGTPGVSPLVRNETSSSNWSGYVSAPSLTTPVENSVNQVSGRWVVPALLPTSDTGYCAFWVGIDGYTSATVEQIGTSHNWVDGKQQNYAWFEMYPQGPYQITGFPVDKGDVIAGEVNYLGDGVFEMTIRNVTKGVHVVIPTSYTTSTSAQRSCAEWVVEAPSSGQGILPLADFGSATFTHCFTNIQGSQGTINSSSWESDEILMQSGDSIKAKPSSLVNQGRRFHVAWEHE